MDESHQITPSDTGLEQEEQATGHQQIATAANTSSTRTESSSAEEATQWPPYIKDYLTRRVAEFFQIEMPERIRYLTALLEKPTFAKRNCTGELNVAIADRKEESTGKTVAEMSPRGTQSGWTTVTGRGNIQFRVLPSGDVECKQPIFELRFVVYPFVKTLKEDINLLQTWIVEPKVPDDRYFEISIDENMLVAIEKLEGEVESVSSLLCRHRAERSKLESKMDMDPQNEDYRRQIAEMDRKDCLRLGKKFRVIRNRYCMLHEAVVGKLKTSSKGKSLNNLCVP